MKLLVIAALCMFTATVSAQAPQAPDDRYVKQLAGKPLEEGKGFPGVIALGTPTPEMYKALGPGRENMDVPFWYFYDLGPWTLVVVAESDAETGQFVTRAIEISGGKAPATKRGARIGDPIKKIVGLYGKAEAFSSSVGSPLYANMMSIDVKTGVKHPLPDTEQAYKDSRYYPALSTLFVVAGGKVEKIVVVLTDDPLPVFLRDPATVKPSTMVVIDPSIDEPGYGKDPGNVVLHVPAPPALAPVKAAGFTLDVPKAWTKAGTAWTDKSGTEFVNVTETKAPGGKAQDFFAQEEQGFGANLVIPKQRALPGEFAATLGADAAYALVRQEPKKGKHGAPLRSFVLMASKGDRRFVVVVARTASGALPSPDGEALARGVLRSFRIK